MFFKDDISFETSTFVAGNKNIELFTGFCKNVWNDIGEVGCELTKFLATFEKKELNSFEILSSGTSSLFNFKEIFSLNRCLLIILFIFFHVCLISLKEELNKLRKCDFLDCLMTEVKIFW